MINIWYNIIEILLPFDWIRDYDFTKNALLAILFIAPIFGVLGTMVVSNRMAFFSDALGHGAFTGLAIGGAIGFVKPVWAAILFSLAFSVLITLIKHKSSTSTDTVIGVFSSATIAAGIIIVSAGKSSMNKFTAYLVGDILNISPEDILTLVFVSIFVILLWIFFYNKLLTISVNQSLAKSRNINILAYEIVFTSAIAIIVTVSIPWIGLLIINSMLVIPAAASRNISLNIKQYHIYSVAFALFSGVMGLILSYFMDIATGATIVLISAAIYFITVFFKRK